MARRAAIAVLALTALSASIALAQSTKDSGKAPATPPAKHAPADAAKHAPEPPPGMTKEQMDALVAAGTPGPQHAKLARSVGEWSGTTKSWQGPGAEAAASTCKVTIQPMMDGRYVKCEWKGDMPGMGMFHGFGINGFDNVSQQYVSTWIDNMSTGMMRGTGELSSDGSTMTWNYEFNCPIEKKPVAMREVERWVDADTMVLEMFGPDMSTGKEFKMMEATLKRTSKGTAVTAVP